MTTGFREGPAGILEALRVSSFLWHGEFTMADTDIPARLREKLNELEKPSFENRIEFMYVDSMGKVTVGVGHNLSDLGAAGRTTFFQTRKFMVVRAARAVERLGSAAQGRVKGIAVPGAARVGQQATEAEIQADYDYLEQLPGLKTVSPIKERHKVQIQTTVEMNEAAIDAVFEEDLKSFLTQSRAVFTDFDKFPVSCQAALIDLIFNYGKEGFKKNKKNLIAAIKGEGVYKGMSPAARWVEASKLSNRTSANAERNSTVSGWFVDGSKEAAGP